MSHAKQFIAETAAIATTLDDRQIERLCAELVAVRNRGGRLFLLGVGGSAANCAHAVNDFRKLCDIEAYAPTDNVSELTARINDDGWDGAFASWLRGSRLRADDAVFVLSVGGGNAERKVSVNIVEAVRFAQSVGARVLGVVGRDGGYTAQAGDAVVIVPTVADDRVTPHTEAWQAVVWHCLVSHPDLQKIPTKW